MLSFSSTAREEIERIMREAGAECVGIRIRAQRLGRTTFRYQIHLARETDVDQVDAQVDAGSFKVYVDTQTAEWMKGTAIDYVANAMGSGFRIDNPAAEAHWDDPVAKKVQEVIDSSIRPALAQHGGWIELLRVEGETAYVQLGGGCQGCSGASATLSHGVEVVVTREVPEIKRVVDETDHTGGHSPYMEE